jgi:hypothetical protein
LTGHALNSPIIGITPIPSGAGYWLLGSDGGIFSFGSAAFHGSTGAITLNKPVVGMASSSDGNGYWLVASDGGVFSFGDALFHGSAGSLHLNAPIVGMAAAPDGGGYWLVASDGGIFTYGDAVFHGSTGALHLNAPVVGMASTPDGGGYWLVASDGGVFSFGDARFFGSDPGRGITSPAVGMVRSQDGGYTVILSNGQVATYQSSLSITTTNLTATTQGQQVNIALGAGGGTAPYTWSVTGGSAPAGLSLSSGGVLSGLAKAPWSSPFTVSLRDATGAVTSAAVTLDVGAAPTTLAPGQELLPGQSMWSGPNGYWAVMQGDGNFVIYDSSTGHALWSSGTSAGGSHIVMQGDGNLVIYSPGGTAEWSSGTFGNWGVYASMQGDSNFVLYGPSARALWDYGSGLLGYSVSTLYAGQTLGTGQQLWSPDGAYEVVMQGDGNLVLYHSGSALWATFTGGPNFHLSMQGDGNLVVYSAGGVAQWNAGTSGSGLYAVIQVDSNFVIYSPTNGARWDYGSGLLSSGGGGTSTGQKIVNAAASRAGIQYCLGGGNQFGPTAIGCSSGVGYDCTGLTMYAVYQATGIVLAHNGSQGLDGGTQITSASALQPGDLVFFGGSYSSFEHSGVYAGGGLFWDANDYGRPVQEHSMAWEEYAYNFVGGERF